MLKIHLSNGQTLSFELWDDSQRKKWEELSKRDSFQKRITGASLLHNKTLHNLVMPKKFRQRRFSAELLVSDDKQKRFGELLICQADDIRITITAYYTNTPQMVRYDVIKTGIQRHIGA